MLPHARSRRFPASIGDTRRPVASSFASANPPPQEPTHAIVAELERSLTDDPGIRLAGTSGKGRVFYGTDLSPQRFVHAQGGVNSPPSLEAAAIQVNRRNVLAKTRGRPPIVP